jgi:hypothetical protein
MARFIVHQLPELDQGYIKRGLCPWCLIQLYQDMDDQEPDDICLECGDRFSGTLSIED